MILGCQEWIVGLGRLGWQDTHSRSRQMSAVKRVCQILIYTCDMTGYLYHFTTPSAVSLHSGSCRGADGEGQRDLVAGVADTIGLALKLSAAGAGDYRDNADRWLRNQFPAEVRSFVSAVLPSALHIGSPRAGAL